MFSPTCVWSFHSLSCVFIRTKVFFFFFKFILILPRSIHNSILYYIEWLKLFLEYITLIFITLCNYLLYLKELQYMKCTAHNLNFFILYTMTAVFVRTTTQDISNCLKTEKQAWNLHSIQNITVMTWTQGLWFKLCF